jgi:hypothetical protein
MSDRTENPCDIALSSLSPGLRAFLQEYEWEEYPSLTVVGNWQITVPPLARAGLGLSRQEALRFFGVAELGMGVLLRPRRSARERLAYELASDVSGDRR